MSKQWGRRKDNNRAYCKGAVPIYSRNVDLMEPPTKTTVKKVFIDKYGRRHKVRTWVHLPTGQIGYVIDIKDPWGYKIHGLDLELVDPMLTIWSKGWHTSESCSGHVGRESMPAIGFGVKHRSSEDRKVIEKWWDKFDKSRLEMPWEYEEPLMTLWGECSKSMSEVDYGLYQQDIQVITESLPKNKEFDPVVERWRDERVNE